MGNTTTPLIPCPKASWTLIADGAAQATVGVQAAGAAGLCVAVTTSGSAPALTSADFIVLGSGDPSVTLPLTTSNKVYGRGLSADAYARTFQVGV